jgi:hypothetical protein
MPRVRKPDSEPRQTPQLNTRLSAEDLVKLENVCRAEGKTKTELLRKAVLIYLDSYDRKAEEAKRDRLAEAMESMTSAIKGLSEGQRNSTERLAKLAARTLIDVGTLQQVFYKRASDKDRDDLWDEARKNALERLRKKRKGGDPEATEIVKDAVSS